MPSHILIVDDEPNIVVPLQFLMEQNGYQVSTASTGEDAIEIIKETTPDLILLDIMLPGADGFEIAQMLRQTPEYQKIHIIFLSAMGREMDIAKGLALGVDDYVVKPFSNADLVKKIRNMIQPEYDPNGLKHDHQE